MEINQAWVDEQRAVCEAATVAPWSWNGDALTSHWTDVISVFDNEGGASFSLKIDESDRAFIATARTALPAALDALKASMQREVEKDATIERLTAERDAAYDVIARIDYQLEKHQTCAAMGNRQYAHGIRDARKIIAQMLPACAENAPEGSGGND